MTAPPVLPPVDALKRAGDAADERPLRLALWVAAILAAGTALWLAGYLALRSADASTANWNAVWGLTGIAFLFAFVPLPGVTSAILLTLRNDWVLGMLGVLGGGLGSTAAAALLLALGHTGRSHLRKRATKSRRARRLLEWSQRAAQKWTYAGVGVLLVPQFIPRAVVLYAAVLAKLRTVPFLAVVFAGTLVRNLVMFLGFSLIP